MIKESDDANCNEKRFTPASEETAAKQCLSKPKNLGKNLAEIKVNCKSKCNILRIAEKG